MKRMMGILFTLSGVVLITGCSSGSGENSSTVPPTATTAEGLWNGTTSTGRTASGLVLDDGTYWVLYSVAGNPSTVAGLVQGNSAFQNGSITSSNSKDFNLEGLGILDATLNGTYVMKQSLGGTIAYQAGGQGTFATTYDPDYELTPAINLVAGTYSGSAANNEGVTVTLSSQGGISGTSSKGCNFTGTFSPRPRGNVYNVVVTFAGGVCANGTSTVNGVAYYDVGTTTLYSAALNSSRTNGFIFIGTKSSPPPPPNLAKVLFGRAIGFVNGDLLLAYADGSGVVALATDSSANEVSPRLAGNQMVYNKQGLNFLSPRDVWTVNLNGVGAHALAATPADEFVNAVADNWVIYGVAPAVTGLRDLASVSLDGTSHHTLANDPDDEYYRGFVGGRVLFERNVGSATNPSSTNTDLYSINPDGSGLRPLAVGTLEQFVMGTAGTLIIYAQRPSPPQSPADIFAIQVDGVGPVTTLAATPDSEYMDSVIGDRVAYIRCAPLGGQCDLYSVKLDGTDTKALTTNASNEFFTSLAIGNRVVYERNVGPQVDVYSVNIDGTGEIPLATTVNDEHAVGVIGNRVIFSRSILGKDDLFTIDVDGTGGETPLATSPEDEDFRAVVADRIIFERVMGPSFSTSPRDIYSVKPDGSGLVGLATGAGHEEFAGAAGDLVLYETHNGAGVISDAPKDLFSIPADGSAPPSPFPNTSADEFFISSF